MNSRALHFAEKRNRVERSGAGVFGGDEERGREDGTDVGCQYLVPVLSSSFTSTPRPLAAVVSTAAASD